MQFIFEVVPCLILSLFRRFFRRCASILAQHYMGVGGWVGVGEAKTPQVEDMRSLVAHRWLWPYNQVEGTSFRSRVEFQAHKIQLVRSTGANVLAMVSQGCKSSPQKSRPPESAHRRHSVWIAIEYSYKLGQKMN